MSWRDALQPASWRGIPFSVRATEGEFGRRVAVHEFPGRDKPYAEDLGRKTRKLALDAFVLGDDYVVRRNRLLAAFEQGGLGVLVHPYLGQMRATLTNCKLLESTDTGGMATLSLEFVESGEAAFPSISDTTANSVSAAADAASQAVQTSFVARHSVAGKPAFVAAASASIFDTAQAGMTAAVGLVRSQATAVAQLQQQVQAARANVTTLLYTPASAAQALVLNLQVLVRTVADTPREQLALARTFFDFGNGLAAIAPSTTSRAAQRTNQAELVQLVRSQAAAEGARAATRIAFESYQDAVAIRDELVDVLDDVMLTTASDALYDALRGLRAAVVRDVAARGANLARLVAWVPPRTLPALVAAQEVYGDATRAADLVARNAVRHPLFVRGAQALEVLSDGV